MTRSGTGGTDVVRLRPGEVLQRRAPIRRSEPAHVHRVQPVTADSAATISSATSTAMNCSPPVIEVRSGYSCNRAATSSFGRAIPSCLGCRDEVAGRGGDRIGVDARGLQLFFGGCRCGHVANGE